MSNDLLKARRHKIKWTRVVFILVMMAYPLFQLIMFWLVPNFNSIISSFQAPARKPGGGMTIIASVKWFKTIFKFLGDSNSLLSRSLLNSWWYFFTTVIIGMPLTIILSYFIFKKLFGYKVFRVIFFLPSIISGVIMATLFLTFTEYRISPFAHLMSFLMGVPPENTPNLMDDAHKLATICLYTLWSGFGVNLVMFNTAMSRVPQDVIEYGKIEGVGMTRELVQLIVPMIFPTITTVFVLGMASYFSFIQPVMLFDPMPPSNFEGRSWSLAYYIYYLFKAGEHPNPNLACAVGILFAAIGTPIIILIKKGLDKAVQAVEY